MKIKKSPARIAFLIFLYIFLTLLGLLFVIPVWHVVMASFSDAEILTSHTGIVWWPLGKPGVGGYKIVLSSPSIGSGYANTAFYVIVGTIISLVLTIMGAYALSRKTMKYRNVIMLFLSFTMLFNGGMIPTYMLIRKLGMIDTIWAFVIPGCLNVFNIILMRTSMQGISDALEEAARLDGANDFVIMFKIILPLCKATFAVVMLFTIVGQWNNFMSAMLYLSQRDDLNPLQMELRTILWQSTKEISSSSDFNAASVYARSIEYAAIVISTLPVLVVYPFVQKYFVTGMTVGAVKA